jgi:hypothetical protein
MKPAALEKMRQQKLQGCVGRLEKVALEVV